jgi:hypothetical protein
LPAAPAERRRLLFRQGGHQVKGSQKPKKLQNEVAQKALKKGRVEETAAAAERDQTARARG